MNASPDPKHGKTAFYSDCKTKPETPSPNLTSIPSDLKSVRAWVVWKFVWKPNGKGDGKWDKIPYKPNGKKASTTNPDTWLTFDEAVSAYKAGGFDGIGFVFDPADGFAGIDLDNVRNAVTGDLKAEAITLIERFATYNEASPSGTGVKLFGRGQWPKGWNRRPFTHGSEIEAYSKGRFFTVTGLVATDYPISDIQTAINETAIKYGKPKKDKAKKTTVNSQTVAPGEDDNALIERAKRSANGTYFSRLYNGDTSDHGGDDSRADMALCMMLAFWLGKDSGRMDTAFRQSRLMRPKWDENRGETTYGKLTISKAIEEQKETYNPTVRLVIGNDPEDATEAGDKTKPNPTPSTAEGGDSETESESPGEEGDPPPPKPNKTTQREESAIQNLTESLYASVYGQTWLCNSQKDETTNTRTVTPYLKLANFTAKIIGETVTDDGVVQTREYKIEATQGSYSFVVDVPVDQFESLDWVISRMGARFIISAAKNAKNHLRCAIQEMSCKVLPMTTVYAHTGWVEIEGKWHYLHTGGAVSGPAESDTNPIIRTFLHGNAAKYCLPDPPCGDELKRAVQASLGILNGLVCPTIAFPLLATTYRSALGGTDSSFWLTGPRSTQKSELAALAQQHFGAKMKRLELPANWSSTENALEALAFTIKDALLVIDDFAPTSTRLDSEQQKRSASRVLRAAGNNSGRQRLDRNGSLRLEKPPRGLIFATGEDVPTIPSIQSRLCIVGIQKGDVKGVRLTSCQQDAANGLYAASMSGFLSWLAPNYGEIKSGLESQRAKSRDEYLGKYPNARTPDLVANLLLGLKYLLDFAEDIQAISSAKIAELRAQGELAFQMIGRKQDDYHSQVDPVKKFPEMVASILSSGRGYLADRKGQRPNIQNLECIGWRLFATSYEPRGEKIGWIRDKEIYLDQNITFAKVNELANEQSWTLSISPQTLWTRLKEEKVILRTEDEKTTNRIVIEGTKRPVMVFNTQTILGEIDEHESSIP